MKKFHQISQVSFKDDKLLLEIDGKQYEYILSNISTRLANASEPERNQHSISPSGYGIHWPLLDEDLSIDGLLGIKHIPTEKKKVTLT